MWSARFFGVFPRIFNDHPELRYIFLTLTIQSCPIAELHSTVTLMGKAWNKMSKRVCFPALGFIRSLEVTKGNIDGYCHPHFHVLMAVPSKYFVGAGYLKKSDYAVMWQEALDVDYVPVCDVRRIQPKVDIPEHLPQHEKDLLSFDAVQRSILEVVKYTVKPSDMVKDPKWLLELVTQLHNVRAVAVGGIFKKYLAEDSTQREKMISKAELEGNAGGFAFGWMDEVKRYQYIQSRV